MPTLINSSVSNDLNTAVGGPPASNDVVRLQQGSSNYTDLPDWSAFDLLAFIASRGWLGQQLEDTTDPTASTPLLFDCNQTGAGVVTIESNHRIMRLAGGDTGVWAKLVHRPQSRVSRTRITAVDVAVAEIFGGFLDAGAAADLAAIRVGMTGQLRLAEAGDAFATLIATGNARVTLERSGTTLEISGDAVVTMADITKTVTTLRMRGGTLVWGGDDLDDGSQVAELLAGTLDLRQAGKAIDIKNPTWGPDLRILNGPNGYTTSGTVTNISGGPTVVPFTA